MAVISHHCYYFNRARTRMLDDSYVQLGVLFVLNYSFIRNKDSPEVPKDSNDPSRTIGKAVSLFPRCQMSYGKLDR